MKNSILSILVLVLCINLHSQKKESVNSDSLIKKSKSKISKSFSGLVDNISVESWVLVDTIPNSLSIAVPSLTPIAYDQSSDALIFVHRGSSPYAQSSFEIWYNLSTDQGETWNRVSSLNNNLDQARFPSASISNPTNGSLSSTKGVFTWMHTNYPGFTGIGIDSPLGSGNVNSFNDSALHYSVIWTDEDWNFWAGEQNYKFIAARTQDFSSIEYNVVFDSLDNFICLGGVGYQGKQYLGFLGTFEDPDPINPILGGWYPAYYKSTDNGITWEKHIIDFRNILPDYDRLFDFIKNDAFHSYSGDINVDKNGYVHIILSLTDTTTDANTGINSIVELFETESGWKGSVIYEGIDDNAFTTNEGPGAEQMGPTGYIAFDKDREHLACVWVANNPSSPLGLCDIFVSWRNIYSDVWFNTENITNTDSINENGVHLAPQLYFNSSFSYKAFVGYFYQLDYTGPTPNNLALTGYWIAPINFTYSDISEPSAVDLTYSLSQNYPNPFNPTTKISWQSSVAGHQTLKVYDVLGNEVATLVNEFRNAGNYEFVFDGSKLSSGVYFYQLRAEDFIQTKKMILIK